MRRALGKQVTPITQLARSGYESTAEEELQSSTCIQHEAQARVDRQRRWYAQRPSGVAVTFIKSKATGHTISTDPSRSHYITSVGRLKPTHIEGGSRRRGGAAVNRKRPEKVL